MITQKSGLHFTVKSLEREFIRESFYLSTLDLKTTTLCFGAAPFFEPRTPRDLNQRLSIGELRICNLHLLVMLVKPPCHPLLPLLPLPTP
jgi:hypothetical protein